MVWKSTRRVGCAVKADCPGYHGKIAVCEYDPPANKVSEPAALAAEVFAPGGGPDCAGAPQAERAA